MPKPSIALFTSQNYPHPAPFDVEETIRHYGDIFSTDRVRSLVTVHQCAAARRNDIEAELTEHKPFLAQFDCHGNPFELELRDGDLDVDPLGELCAKNGVHCVLLMSCDSNEFAEQLAKHVPVAIGTTRKIYDDEVFKFTESFYRYLLGGMSVNYAFLKANTQNLFSMFVKTGTVPNAVKLPQPPTKPPTDPGDPKWNVKGTAVNHGTSYQVIH